MIQTFSIFAKQILSFSGFQSSRIPVKVYKAFMTAFQDMLNHDVVMLEPVLKRLKSVPGRLILDDTSNPKYGLKQWTRKLKILSTSGYQDGYKILLFLWDCSLGRIPIGFALWHKATHSLNELALQGLSQLRNHYPIKPQVILADGAFSTDKTLKRLTDYGWAAVMRFKQNRRLGGKRIKMEIPRGYGHCKGLLNNQTRVKIFRRKNRFYVCNRMLWSMDKAIKLYTKRWKIEEVFRALKGCLRLNGCQQHSIKAQALYLVACFTLFSYLEMDSTQSVYKTAQSVISGEQTLENILQQMPFTLL